METVAEGFRTGGIWMYLVLALAMVVYPVFFGATVMVAIDLVKETTRPKRRLLAGGFCLAGAVALVVVGGLGWQVGIAEMQGIAETASAENAEQLRQRGRTVARYPLIAAGTAAVLPGVGGIVFLLTGLFADEERQHTDLDSGG